VSENAPWWRGATVYQVYVRSFADSNGDGVGDFEGLISKLDYIAALGVDALWLSPVRPSPNRDWGYDVSDYDTVNPEYGSEADFDRLLNQAHARGLKVMTDEVLAHTSDEHAWFVESLEGGEKAAWYVWAPAREDGTAPNNWLSAFGGPAWSYHPARRASYHHKFLRQQPKLNWQDPAAREAALRVLDRWLACGVDGFRLDVANAFLHDPNLADNPAVPEPARNGAYWSRAANMQLHRHDSNLPENIQVLDEIRCRVERHPDRFVMGEFSEDPERCGAFASPTEGLHSGYSFPLLHADVLGPDFVHEHYRTLARFPAHWPSIAFSNHDVIRTVTRFGGDNPPPALARLLLAVLTALRGTLLLYQGEELGLPEASLRRDQIKDPIGDLYYPLYRGRDGCRTPMPWNDAAPDLGFTSGSPWLPLAPEHRELAVSRQERDSQSTLSYARRLFATRKASAALRLGDIEFLDAPSPVLAFLRNHGEQRYLCVFNMSGGEAALQSKWLPEAAPLSICTGGSRIDADVLSLRPYAAFFASLA
jgi:alpha-glucosidase